MIYIELYVLQLHEYLRESAECSEWISQQTGTARSQDLGQDYEHLELLLARFQEFKLLVQAGVELYLGTKTAQNRASSRPPASSSLKKELISFPMLISPTFILYAHFLL